MDTVQEQGYTVLSIDLPGQGASTASAVTFGLREAHGVRAALDELRRRVPGQHIGVIGVSLGAASLVLCNDCGHLDAVVLESMYPTIEEALANRLRMRLGALGGPLSTLLLWQLPVRLGIRPEQLRPIGRMRELKAPVLVAAGSDDRHTTLPETRRLFAAAARPDDLWIVQDAAHVDLHSFAPAEYERRIGAFMARHLRPGPKGSGAIQGARRGWSAGNPLHRDGRRTVAIGLAFLRQQHDQHDPADQRDEHHEQPPAAAVGIVQAARTGCQRWQQGRQSEERAKRVAHQADRECAEHAEQPEPPVLGALRNAVEGGVFLETDGNRFGECHVVPVRLHPQRMNERTCNIPCSTRP
jgi:alpha-beta hydrolase superfamily lysophospholipase